MVMSALPLKADVCVANRHVCFWAKSRDIAPPHSIISSARGLHRRRRAHAERLGGLEVNHQFEFSWNLNGQVAWLRSAQFAFRGARAAEISQAVGSVCRSPAVRTIKQQLKCAYCLRFRDRFFLARRFPGGMGCGLSARVPRRLRVRFFMKGLTCQ